MLLHLHSVSKNHVQVEHQILDLQFQTYIYQMKKNVLPVPPAYPFHELQLKNCKQDDGCCPPALGKVCPAALSPLRHMSRLS